MSNWTDGMGDLGGWSVVGNRRQRGGRTPGPNHQQLRDAAQLGQPSWSNTKLTNVLDRMNNGFDDVVDNWGDTCPTTFASAPRKPCSTTCHWCQVGKALTQAYVNCIDAEGNDVVASWNQVQHADLVDQFLFYDELYNGNFGNSKVLAPSPMDWKPGGSRCAPAKSLPTDWVGRQASDPPSA